MNVDNINELYTYAKHFAGDLGQDLVHHILLEHSTRKYSKDTAYLKNCIRNAYFNPKSTFNKLYHPLGLDELNDIEDIHHQSDNYDPQLLHSIFLQLEIEGYGLEVQVYKDCTFASSIVKFSKTTQINPRTITKITKFVHNEIIRRYSELEFN